MDSIKSLATTYRHASIILAQVAKVLNQADAIYERGLPLPPAPKMVQKKARKKKAKEEAAFKKLHWTQRPENAAKVRATRLKGARTRRQRNALKRKADKLNK